MITVTVVSKIIVNSVEQGFTKGKGKDSRFVYSTSTRSVSKALGYSTVLPAHPAFYQHAE